MPDDKGGYKIEKLTLRVKKKTIEVYEFTQDESGTPIELLNYEYEGYLAAQHFYGRMQDALQGKII